MASVKMIMLVMFSLSSQGVLARISGSERNADSNGNAVEDCLQKDSVSCLQLQMFRMARSFFNNKTIELFDGAELVKEEKSSRNFAVDTGAVEEELVSSDSINKKAEVLEKYIMAEASNFFASRSFQWSVESLARNLISLAPEEIKKAASDFISESRGRKKMMKSLLPFLLALKLKFSSVMALVFFGVTLLAKKAIMMSLISIAISGYFAAKKLFNRPQTEFSGWSSHSDTGHVEYVPSQQAHEFAYGGQKNF